MCTTRLQILLAEDNPLNQRVLTRLLEGRGWAVALVGNGKQAVAAVEARRFDLILMDVEMPEMGGLEATRAIRVREAGRGGRVPIVAVTTCTAPGDRERCQEAGMDAYVTKPVRPAELFGAVARLVHAAGLAGSVPSPAEQELNLTALLDRIGGDRAFLRELAGIFLKDCPSYLAQLGVAVRTGNAGGVAFAAHTLKGSLSHFGAEAATQVARRLEDLGRHGDLAGADAAYAELTEAIGRLTLALERVRDS